MGSSDTCYSSGGSPDECRDNMDESECKDYDSKKVNGGHWSTSSKSCPDLGFTKDCHNHVFMLSTHSC